MKDAEDDVRPEDLCGEVGSPYVEVTCSNLLCSSKCLVIPGVTEVKTWVFCATCIDLVNRRDLK